MSDLFVQADALGTIARQLDRAAAAAEQARDTFNAGAAVANTGGNMLPDGNAEQNYTQAVSGTVNQLDEIVVSLHQWALAWRETEAFYRDADTSAAQTVNDGVGEVLT